MQFTEKTLDRKLIKAIKKYWTETDRQTNTFLIFEER